MTAKKLDAVYVALTDDEASQLMAALRNFESAKPGWHDRVSATDFQMELTIYRADDPTAVF